MGKFRVYNSRKYQVGGDRPDTYFEQTANIAGIEDARVQQLMPDALRFVGVTKIDRLLSMSKDKYDALTKANIEIGQRVSLPESWVPANATVEITAKIAAGYNAFQPELGEGGSAEPEHDHLWTLDAVRERSHRLLDIGVAGQLPNFKVDIGKLDAAVDQVLDTISNNYPTLDIPIHSRMRHFESGGFNRMRDLELGWSRDGIDAMEAVRRKIDLVVVSVLLDAGAGAGWKYHEQARDSTYMRSEGLAVASYDMFRNGLFSTTDGGHTADADALLAINLAQISEGFQISDTNPMVGLEGRTEVLHKLGVAMQTNHHIFQRNDTFRPGNILDHVLRETLVAKAAGQSDNRTSLRVLWKSVVEGLGEVFPDPSGKNLGDCWHHPSLGEPDNLEAMIPFHKLTQWLTYSLIEPFSEFGIKFVDNYLLTGLAEYRNGGLFVDSGVLVPRDPSVFDDEHLVSSELVVEWRGLTVALLDKSAERIWDRLGVSQQKMPLAQILEGGTWAAGRELAFKKRPKTGDPPIRILSEGNTF